MYFNKQLLFLIFLTALSIQIVSAQGVWSVNRSKGAGDLTTVYFTSNDKGWVAGDHGYLAWTVDRGKNWTQQDIGTTENINEIYFRNDDNGYLVAGRKLFITKDAGRSWVDTRIYKLTDFKGVYPEFLSIKFADKKRGIIIGSVLKKQGSDDKVVESLVMRTDDGGETWNRVLVPSKIELYHLAFAGTANCWIVGDGGLILYSRDGGITFNKQVSGTDKDLYNVDFRDSSEGYAVGSKGTILRTENGGALWQTVSANSSETFMRVDFADDKNGWIVGYQGTILRSNDKGKNWAKQESGSPENFYGLYMMKKYGWTVGAGGVIISYQK